MVDVEDENEEKASSQRDFHLLRIHVQAVASI